MVRLPPLRRLVTDCRRPLKGFYIEACAEARWRVTDEHDPCIFLLRLSEVFRRTLEVAWWHSVNGRVCY